ncbi:MAG: hypothetical protein BHW63_02580 [Mycoplasma sp. CAG:611_25_7]|nr:MAG: hypothetical protein BHW63_02580 [Mycoplasma sp. CAG:611_25_7]
MLANIITITRLLLIIPFGILLYNKGIQNLVPACLFTFIIITDFLDGYVARKYKQVTKFGKLLDPFVDKLLIVVTTIILIIKNIIPIYSLYIFIRDIIIWILALTMISRYIWKNKNSSSLFSYSFCINYRKMEYNIFWSSCFKFCNIIPWINIWL